MCVPNRRPPLVTRRHRLLGSLLAAAAALAATELLLRLCGMPAPLTPSFAGRELTEAGCEPDPELFWVLRPAPGTNRFGLRGYEPAAARGARDLRVLCLGESVVSGPASGWSLSFGMLLERRLQTALPNARVETVLGGLPGWSVVQARRLLETRLRDFGADVTVVHVGVWNDQLPAYRRPDLELGALAPPTRFRCWDLLRRLAAWSGPPAAELARDPARAPYGRRVPLEQFRGELERIVAVARDGGGSVLFVLPARRPDVRGVNPISADYRRTQQEVAAALSVPVVDAMALCDRYEQDCGGIRAHSGIDLYADALHLGLAGHELVAKALFEAIAAAPPPRWPALAAADADANLSVCVPWRRRPCLRSPAAACCWRASSTVTAPSTACGSVAGWRRRARARRKGCASCCRR
jgi:lysophospholipase L1-like esterase